MNLYPTIIVAGYRRQRSIERLLNSLRVAKFPSAGVNIVISLDGGYSEEVLHTSKDFASSFTAGKVNIIARKENIGLKNHMMWCGNQTEKYGAVIVLEDDLYLDPQFYEYALAALEHYKSSEKIAGIALYSQRYNEYADLAFLPFENGYSTYLMQVACSWGQLWTAEHWKGFKEWYLNNKDQSLETVLELPERARNWSNNSWKKYYSAYLALTNKYFVYPYRSYSTNCSDPGGKHNSIGSNRFQVPMALGFRKDDLFTFCDVNKEIILYDSYMEPSAKIVKQLFQLDIDDQNLCIDFYASKPASLIQQYHFCLSSKGSTQPIEAYNLSFKPFEMLKSFGTFKSGDIMLTKTEHLKSTPYPKYYLMSRYLSNFAAGNKYFTPQLLSQKIAKVWKKLKS